MEDWLAITDELERRTSLRQARTASHYELPNEEASSGGSSSTHPYSSSYARPVQPTKAPTQGPVGGIQEPDSAPASPAMPPPPPPHKPPGKMKAQDERHKPSRASPAELVIIVIATALQSCGPSHPKEAAARHTAYSLSLMPHPLLFASYLTRACKYHRPARSCEKRSETLEPLRARAGNLPCRSAHPVLSPA